MSFLNCCQIPPGPGYDYNVNNSGVVPEPVWAVQNGKWMTEASTGSTFRGDISS